MDLSRIPTEDLKALNEGDLSRVSTGTLRLLQSYQATQQAGVDTKAMDQRASANRYFGGDVSKASLGEQFIGGAKSAWDQAALGLRNLVPEGVASRIDALDQMIGNKQNIQDITKQGQAFVAETGPASSVGEFAGNVALSAAPAFRATQAVSKLPLIAKSPLAQRALGGGIATAALAPEDKLEQGAMATALGPLAEGGMRALGKVGGGLFATSNVSPDAQKLIDVGVAVPPWKSTTSDTYRAMGERLKGPVLTSRVINNAEMKGMEDFNRVLIKDFTPPDLILEGGQVIGVRPAQTAVKDIGQKGLRELKGRFNLAYDKLYRGKSIPIDDEFNTAVGAMSNDFKQYYPSDFPDFNGRVKKYNDFLTRGTQEGRVGVNADALKRTIGEVDDDISKAYSGGKAELADMLKNYKAELEMLRVRGLPPGADDAVKAINDKYVGFIQYQTAMGTKGANKANMVSPDQFLTAIKKADKSVRKGNFAMGSAKNQEFAQLADRVLGSELPNVGPGTAEKLLGLAALTSPFTLGADYAAALALGSKPGQQFLVGQLPAQAKIRQGVNQFSPLLSRNVVPSYLLSED